MDGYEAAADVVVVDDHVAVDGSEFVVVDDVDDFVAVDSEFDAGGDYAVVAAAAVVFADANAVEYSEGRGPRSWSVLDSHPRRDHGRS